MTRNIDLRLHKRTDEVFSKYEEMIVSKAIVFEGVLLPHNARASDKQVIWFLSGWSRYVSYELERDGAYVRGWIRYRPAESDDTKNIEQAMSKLEEAIGQVSKKRPQTRAASDEQVDEIRSMHARGMSQRAIARDFGIHYMIVHNIVNRKGAYAD